MIDKSEMTELSIIAIVPNDPGAGLPDETYEVNNVYIDDDDHTHREFVRECFGKAFGVLCGRHAQIFFTDEMR